MAFSLNRVILIGRLGKDAETRTTSTNLAISNFSLATENSYKDKDGNWQNETTWHNVDAWNLSEFYLGKLKKGAMVCVEGRIKYEEYTDKEGNPKKFTKIVAQQIIPLEGKEGRTTDDSRGSSNSSYSREQSERSVKQIPNTEGNDDLPF